jgi:TctA family transporter
MATALLVPFAMFLDPVSAIASIVAATAMAIFAGDIPGTLLRLPGTPASAAYVHHSYRLAMSGRAGEVLGLNLVFSALGGLLGTVVLVAAAPTLADYALSLSSFEFFWLSILGLSCAVFLVGDNIAKGAAALLFGLLLATVGRDYSTGFPRFTFGDPELYNLASDLSESRNLASEDPERVQAMLGRMKQSRIPNPRFPHQALDGTTP